MRRFWLARVPRLVRRGQRRDRICALHFKDHVYLGEGRVDYPAVLRAIEEVGFRGDT